MHVLLLELSGTDSVSRMPKRYGGVGRTLRLLAENLDQCCLLAEESCFEDDLSGKCFPCSKGEIYNIKNGVPIESIVKNNFDIIIHAHPNLYLNTEKKQIVWAPGFNETIHQNHKHLLLHNVKGQCPKILNSKTTVHPFVLGIDIPEYKEYKKEDFIFQCSNHYQQINTHLVINFCNNYQIKGYFAGPISEDYKIKPLFDNKNTFYLGVISEEEKIEYLKKAKLVSALYAHAINECPLAIKQALSYNCGIITTPAGDMVNIISEGLNGFVIQYYDHLPYVWTHKDKIKQENCYSSVLKYSTSNMVSSIKDVLEKIVKDR